VHDGPDRQATCTVVANGPIAKERTVGARQPVIVHGSDNRNPRIAASMEHSIAEQRKRNAELFGEFAIGGNAVYTESKNLRIGGVEFGNISLICL